MGGEMNPNGIQTPGIHGIEMTGANKNGTAPNLHHMMNRPNPPKNKKRYLIFANAVGGENERGEV